ncbi:MAG: tripartite tricarboxylate transporter substrate binding protein [Alphaproteobacteria bacterium]|jgi:tripartite-type tricarboxylate transporter receptor subunit TctC|nr:tripartite tricarboxylate transporter substrate binding protein [Alphaproteobacteria bacterium]MDC3311407.1 tripartite tricarboxylate transporter substrate binding protein [Alphaproteobacteria bacterium]
MKLKLNSVIKGTAASILGAAMAFTANVALADYPEKDITFIVPYSPGGGSDQMARRLQPGLEKALGVNVRIVYKTGGGGAVGFSELHRSKPDGYTIANVVVPNVILSSKGDGVGYKPGDFEYIGMTESAVGALMVPKDSPYKTLDAFVAAALEKPGMLTVAGVGGTGADRWGALADILGIDTTYVPVSGGVGKMMPMLAGSHVDAGMTASNHATKHKSIVDALVIAGKQEVTTLKGVPFEPKWSYVTTWGIMAPPGTPADIIATLNAALNEAASDSSVADALSNAGYNTIIQTVDEVNAFMDEQIKAYQ